MAAELVKFTDLKEGDQFIWADSLTRRVMLAEDRDYTFRNNVCTVIWTDPVTHDIKFECDATEYILQWADACRVFRLDNGLHTMIPVGFGTLCCRPECRKTYGEHVGILCPTSKRGTFVPAIEFIVTDHSDWMKQELGL